MHAASHNDIYSDHADYLQVCIILYRDETLWIQLLSGGLVFDAHSSFELLREFKHKVSILGAIADTFIEVLSSNEPPDLARSLQTNHTNNKTTLVDGDDNRQ